MGEHAGLGRSFFGSERLALALPFALSTPPGGIRDLVVFSDPHFVLARSAGGTRRRLAGVMLSCLASPMMIEPAHDPNPLLALRPSMRMEVAGAALFGCVSSIGDAAPGGRWRSAMLQLVTDPDMRLPSDLLSGLVRNAAVSSDVKLEGTQTLAHGAEYAALESSRALGSSPAFVDAEQMWDAARAELEDPNYALVEARLDLLFDLVHDSRPLDLLQSDINRLARAATPCYTRRDQIVAEVRRSIDPFGYRWALESSDLESWLMEKNSKGLTRLSYLYVLDVPLLLDRFPGVSHSPSEFLDWHENHWAELSRSISPGMGTDIGSADVHGYLGGPERTRPPQLGAKRRTLADQYDQASHSEILRYGRPPPGRYVLYGPDLARKRGTNPPRAVSADRESVRWPRSASRLSLIGCFRSESGLGQAARSSLAAVRLLGKDFTYIDTSEKYPSRNAVSAGLERERFGAIGDVNLIHSNADEMLTLRDKVFKHRFGGRFNAAMWFWEPADSTQTLSPSFRAG